jgi:hypothetical protein
LFAFRPCRSFPSRGAPISQHSAGRVGSSRRAQDAWIRGNAIMEPKALLSPDLALGQDRRSPLAMALLSRSPCIKRPLTSSPEPKRANQGREQYSRLARRQCNLRKPSPFKVRGRTWTMFNVQRLMPQPYYQVGNCPPKNGRRGICPQQTILAKEGNRSAEQIHRAVGLRLSRTPHGSQVRPQDLRLIRPSPLDLSSCPFFA